MTDQEVKEIADRCNAATDGSWKSFIEGRDHASGSSFIMLGEGSRRSADIELIGATPEDQDFIAHARQDIPRLLDEIERLKAVLEERTIIPQ